MNILLKLLVDAKSKGVTPQLDILNKGVRLKNVVRRCQTLSVAVLKWSISVRKVLEAEVFDSLLTLVPRGAPAGVGWRQRT